jgi:hypothetical protein
LNVPLVAEGPDARRIAQSPGNERVEPGKKLGETDARSPAARLEHVNEKTDLAPGGPELALVGVQSAVIGGVSCGVNPAPMLEGPVSQSGSLICRHGLTLD